MEGINRTNIKLYNPAQPLAAAMMYGEDQWVYIYFIILFCVTFALFWNIAVILKVEENLKAMNVGVLIKPHLVLSLLWLDGGVILSL